MVFSLKRTWLAILLFALCILPALAVTLAPAAKASSTQTSLDVEVDHVVQIKDGGLVIINDTVKLLTKSGESVMRQNYTLGFPYAYQSNLDFAFAYETKNPNSSLKLELNAGMGKIGFYGVNVVFPQAVNISNDKPYQFTVVFVFSNRISFRSLEQTILYNASFPAYPSLTQSASKANLTIVFPVGLNYTSSSYKQEGLNFTRTVTGSKQYFKYDVKNNLTEFSDQTGWFAFLKSASALRILEVNEVRRGIEFSGLEKIVVSDSYRMVSKADKLAQIEIKLPKGAFDVSEYDEFGSLSFTNVTLTFATPFDEGEEARFLVRYQLPWKNHTSTESWSVFRVSLTLFENVDWTIRKLTTTITLPEGATLTSSPVSAGLNSVQNSAFQSSLTFVFQNATPFQKEIATPFNFKYGRVVFWESFRPTLWMGFLVMVIGAIVGAWRVYRPPTAPVPTAIIRIRAEELRSFVDSYDEKRRYQREIESLEAQAKKGKIPRRLYKVRRVSAENRLTSLSRDLSALTEKIHRAGPRYADLMRQLEVAETELQGVEADISRTEVRYRRGEISAAAYHKLLEDSYRRRDRSKTTIDGVLLRLREEIS